MGALVSAALLTERLGRGLAGMFRKDAGLSGRWLWPTGNGDRGPPGSWQRNLGTNVDPAALVAFSAVYSCVQIIAGDLAKLPIGIFEVMPTSEEKRLRNDPYEVLMREPNDYQSGVDFIQTFMLSTLIHGNGYALKEYNGRNEVVRLHPWDARQVIPTIAQDGSVFYRMGANRLAGYPVGLIAPARDVIHHRMPMSSGMPLVGVTPIFAAASSSAMGLRILENSQVFFGNMARPSGTLSSATNVTKVQADQVAEAWERNYSGEGIGKTAVLPFGLTWQAMTMNAVDAQLIEQLRWSVEDVARVFRVPTFMIGDTSKVTYRNSEQLGRTYLQGCLGYHVKALQDRLNLAFDFGNRFRVQFDLDALLTTEIDTRYSAYTAALQAGWLKINEVRAIEGYGPVSGGNEPMIQVQNVPLSVAVDNAKNPKPPPAPAPAPAPAPPKALDADKLAARVALLMGET